MNKFWMLFAEGGQTPAVRHDNIVEAMREAQRIAEKTERNCYVLEYVGVVVCKKEVLTRYEEVKYESNSNVRL